MTEPAAQLCATCFSQLHTWELEAGRANCQPCQQRVDQHLRALPGETGLYARLSGALTPGAGSGGPAVSGSKTAPLPLRLEPLSLSARGGVVTILQTWLIDWHEQLGWGHPRWTGNLQQQCDQAVHALRVNLGWAATCHPAFAEFATEIAQLRRQCEVAVTGERTERPVKVACPCGCVLRVTVSTNGARCPRCETQYGRDEVLNLPLATRAAA